MDFDRWCGLLNPVGAAARSPSCASCRRAKPAAAAVPTRLALDVGHARAATRHRHRTQLGVAWACGMGMGGMNMGGRAAHEIDGRPRCVASTSA